MLKHAQKVVYKFIIDEKLIKSVSKDGIDNKVLSAPDEVGEKFNLLEEEIQSRVAQIKECENENKKLQEIIDKSKDGVEKMNQDYEKLKSSKKYLEDQLTKIMKSVSSLTTVMESICNGEKIQIYDIQEPLEELMNFTKKLNKDKSEHDLSDGLLKVAKTMERNSANLDDSNLKRLANPSEEDKKAPNREIPSRQPGPNNNRNPRKPPENKRPKRNYRDESDDDSEQKPPNPSGSKPRPQPSDGSSGKQTCCFCRKDFNTENAIKQSCGHYYCTPCEFK